MAKKIFLLFFCILFASFLLPVLAQAKDLYAAPNANGSDAACPKDNPCSFSSALQFSEDNDRILLQGGLYSANSNTYTINKRITIKAAHPHKNSQLPYFYSDSSFAVLRTTTEAKLEDFAVYSHASNESTLHLEGNPTLRGITAVNSGGYGTACLMQSNITIRDSLCLNQGGGAGMRTAVGNGRNINISVNNVTALAQDSTALQVTSGNSYINYDIKNSIFDSNTGYDIYAYFEGVPPSDNRSINFDLAYSNFDHPVLFGGEQTNATLNTENHNQGEEPVFLEPGRQLAESPTVDAGTPREGSALDYQGEKRNQESGNDIGADEFDTIRPEIELLTGPDNEVTNNSTPTWTFQVEDLTAEIECRVNNEQFVSCDDGVFSAPTYNVSTANQTFEIRARDASNFTETFSTEYDYVDNQAPQITITKRPQEIIHEDGNVEYQFNSDDPQATLECVFHEVNAEPYYENCNGTFIRNNLPVGDYLFEVRSTDLSDNTGIERDYFSVRDLKAPEITVTKKPDGFLPEYADVDYKFESDDPQAILRCAFTREDNEREYRDCSDGTFSKENLKEGNYLFSLEAKDINGNVELFTQTIRVRDRKDPNTIFLREPKDRSDDRRQTVRFESSERDSDFECKLDERKWRDCQSGKLLKLKPGEHVFKVRSIDDSGNVDESPAKSKFEVVRRR